MGSKEKNTGSDTLKIDVSAVQIVALISVFSTVFFVSGYLYIRLLFNKLGVDVSNFFTLSDYIAASISRIADAFIVAVISIIGFYAGRHRTLQKSRATIVAEHKTVLCVYISMVFVSLAIAVYGYFFSNRIFYIFTFIAVASISPFLFYFLSHTFFKKPLPVMFSLIFLFNFTGYMCVSVGKTIAKLESNETHSMSAFNVKLKDNATPPNLKFVLITANSGYLFLQDQNGKIHIIARSQLKYLEQR